jgi:hypothetical protein
MKKVVMYGFSATTPGLTGVAKLTAKLGGWSILRLALATWIDLYEVEV